MCIKRHQNASIFWKIFRDSCKSNECNTKEVVELTWSKIKISMLTREGQRHYLMSCGQNLLQASSRNRSNPDVHDFCRKLLKESSWISYIRGVNRHTLANSTGYDDRN